MRGFQGAVSSWVDVSAWISAVWGIRSGAVSINLAIRTDVRPQCSMLTNPGYPAAAGNLAGGGAGDAARAFIAPPRSQNGVLLIHLLSDLEIVCTQLATDAQFACFVLSARLTHRDRTIGPRS